MSVPRIPNAPPAYGRGVMQQVLSVIQQALGNLDNDIRRVEVGQQIIFDIDDTAYTIASINAGGFLRFRSSTDVTITLADDTVSPVREGSSLYIRQAGTGNVSFVTAAGVTLNAASSPDITGQGGTRWLVKTAANTWDAVILDG